MRTAMSSVAAMATMSSKRQHCRRRAQRSQRSRRLEAIHCRTSRSAWLDDEIDDIDNARMTTTKTARDDDDDDVFTTTTPPTMTTATATSTAPMAITSRQFSTWWPRTAAHPWVAVATSPPGVAGTERGEDRHRPNDPRQARAFRCGSPPGLAAKVDAHARARALVLTMEATTPQPATATTCSRRHKLRQRPPRQQPRGILPT